MTPGFVDDNEDMKAPSASVISLSVSDKYSEYFSIARPLFFIHFLRLFLLFMTAITTDIRDIGIEYISML